MATKTIRGHLQLRRTLQNCVVPKRHGSGWVILVVGKGDRNHSPYRCRPRPGTSSTISNSSVTVYQRCQDHITKACSILPSSIQSIKGARLVRRIDLREYGLGKIHSHLYDPDQNLLLVVGNRLVNGTEANLIVLHSFLLHWPEECHGDTRVELLHETTLVTLEFPFIHVETDLIISGEFVRARWRLLRPDTIKEDAGIIVWHWPSGEVLQYSLDGLAVDKRRKNPLFGCFHCLRRIHLRSAPRSLCHEPSKS
ncbi:hypothetical protein K474DRAFT_98643 [Panus rudis PR-1116 ss-1]|nr:hypothetical protein K474DRAFT_98643 [Panus rudis PR-1116 ss-1]